MRLSLIFPPLADISQPYSALPVLTAFLKQNGIDQVRQMDVNIEFSRFHFKREPLESVLDRINLRLKELDSLNFLDERERIEYGLIINAMMKAPVVLPAIEGAVESLKRPESFHDIEKLSRSKRFIQEGLQILSAASYPHRLSFTNSHTQLYPTMDELRYRACEWAMNPYREFFSNYTVPELKQHNPGAIGISITYQSQILPAITLAALIKTHLAHVPIILGGSIISVWYDGIENCPDIFQFCDYLIPFEGESALLGLLRAIEHQIPMAVVPNIVYFEWDQIVKNPVTIEDINALPTPDYSGLPLDLYLSPENTFLLYTSRGCYWSKCAFCSVSCAMREKGRHRQRNIDLISNDIITTVERHHSKYITFCDDCVSPSTLKALVKKLKSEGPTIVWQCEARFEDALTSELLKEMRDAGCLNLIFGLESYAPRLRSIMNKGIRHSTIERVLNDCRQNGIAFNLQFFFGFPGETEEEAGLTSRFIQSQAHGGATFSFGTFELFKGSPIESNPEQYHIHINRSTGPLAVTYHFEPEVLHSRKMKGELRDFLYQNIKYPFARLSIDAHTLIFLDHSGIEALEKIYEKKHAPIEKNIEECQLVLCKEHVIGSFVNQPGITENEEKENGYILIYDHESDHMVEVSPLVIWFVQQMDGTQSFQMVMKKLKKEVSLTEREEKSIYNAINKLYRKGFLKDASGGQEPF
ncbi:MAG: B12-binding domain-containing radical SAM protein [Candidatus Omnitrophota bacterium]